MVDDRSPSTLLANLIDSAVDMGDCANKVVTVVREYLVGSGRERYVSSVTRVP